MADPLTIASLSGSIPTAVLFSGSAVSTSSKISGSAFGIIRTAGILTSAFEPWISGSNPTLRPEIVTFTALRDVDTVVIKSSGSLETTAKTLEAAFGTNPSELFSIPALSEIVRPPEITTALQDKYDVLIRTSGSLETTSKTLEPGAVDISRTAFITDYGAEITTVQASDMYKYGDLMPFITIVLRLDGRPFANATIILEGDVNRVLARTNNQGIYTGFLPEDVYDSGIFISRGHMIYSVETVEELDTNKYQFTIRRETKANATFRTIHRRFE